MKKKAYIYLLWFTIFSLNVKAQFYSLPNDYNFSLLTEKKLAERDSSIHNGIKPGIPFFSKKFTHVADSHIIFKYITEDPALDLFFYKHLIAIEPQNENFKLRLDPILNYQVGKDLVDSTGQKLVTNTRGLVASAFIGNDFYCESMFVENQSFFPNYLNTYSNGSQVVPGQGRYKVFKKTGYDYAFSSSLISYQATKNFNIQAGHGKQKVGAGYRSLLLSDNSFNYPYLRFTQNWFNNKLQYTNIYAVLMNLDSASKRPSPNTERLFQKKPAAFQYLSFNPTKNFNIGLFQGIIWEVGDDRNKQQVNLMYFNPLIYTHSLYYGLNNTNNVLLGADLKIKITNKFNMYGQFMADDLSNALSIGNGYGYQFGFNWFDAFKTNNLFIQAEYNSVSEGAYNSPISAPKNQSYSHYNQNLAFTPNTGNEMILIGDYKVKRFFVNLKYQNQLKKLNKSNDYSNSIISGNVGYLVNPAYNLNISIGYTNRYQKFYNFNTNNSTTSFLFLSIKTNLFNNYYDF